MSSCSRPFRNDVFSCFIVGRKGKRDTGECGAKVNADNQLGLTPTGTFNLNRGISYPVLGLRHSLAHSMSCDRLLQAITRRSAQRLDRLLRIVQVGVQRCGVMTQLLAGGHRAGRPLICIARGTPQRVLVVHRETRRGRTMVRRWGTRRGGVRGRGDECIARCVRWLLNWRRLGTMLVPLRSKSERLEP